MKKLVIVMDAIEPNDKHICNKEECPFFGNKICSTLWSTPPNGRSALASLCNYYNVQDITIAEVDDSIVVRDIKMETEP